MLTGHHTPYALHLLPGENSTRAYRTGDQRLRLQKTKHNIANNAAARAAATPCTTRDSACMIAVLVCDTLQGALTSVREQISPGPKPFVGGQRQDREQDGDGDEYDGQEKSERALSRESSCDGMSWGNRGGSRYLAVMATAPRRSRRQGRVWRNGDVCDGRPFCSRQEGVSGERRRRCHFQRAEQQQQMQHSPGR